MSFTRVRLLVGIGAAALVLTWAGLLAAADFLPVMPWTVPVMLAIFAAGIVVSASALRRRLRGDLDVKAPDPLHAARMAALAKATSHGGAGLSGLYAGLALYFFTSEASPLRRERGVVAALAALAGVALVGAGLFLERVCRVDPPQDEPPPAPR